MYCECGLATYLESLLIDQMKSQPLALAVDGSNNPGLQNMNPVTVRIFYIENCKLSTKFLDMYLTSGVNARTSDSIFHAMDHALTSHNILWHQCIGLSMDSASVNMGKHNSIKPRFICLEISIYVMGCLFHIVHNTG